MDRFIKTLSRFFYILASGILSTSLCQADTYADILSPNYVVTGVRALDSSNNVLLTGTVQGGSSATQAFLYEGQLAGGGTTTLFTPVVNGVTATGATFYGPDTPYFDSSIGAGNIRAVGSYQIAATGVQDHGLLYQGPANGVGGTYTNIDVPISVTGQSTNAVGETIAHSTMGNIAVGDYDLSGVANSANAFIYNLSTMSFTALNIGGSMSNDTTAYGVWENANGTYTIAGGSQKDLTANEGFLVTYDASTDAFSHLTYYAYTTGAGSITHFEGITGTATGYNLIATTDAGAALASIVSSGDGSSYGNITWSDPIANPNSTGTTTGNSIFQDTGMGIYQTSTGVQSYIVTVPEPSTNLLLALSLVGLGFFFFRRRSV